MKSTRTTFFLFIICLIGFYLRFHQLDRLPNSLSSDEVAFGYNAYSILKTGKDEFGHSYPLLFQSFDDHKNPVFAYLLVPIIYLFGLSEWSIRIPSALFGTLSIPFVFALTKILTKNEKLSLLSSWLLALSPWHIQYSRIALEVETAFFFSLLAVLLFLKAQKKQFLYLWSAICFGAGFWTYYASKLWLPLFGGFLAYTHIAAHKQIGKWFLLSGIVFALIAVPYMLLATETTVLSRQYGISVFFDEAESQMQANSRLFDETSGYPLAKMWHNHRLVYVQKLLNGYLAIMSPSLLFAPNSFNHPPNISLLYIWQLPLILIGSVYLIRKKKLFIFVFVWLLLGYLPGAITRLPAFDRRILISSYPLILLTAIGWISFHTYIKRTFFPVRSVLLNLALLFIVFFSIHNYLHEYFTHGNTVILNLWGNSMKEVVSETEKQKTTYQKVIVSRKIDQPLIFYLFYTAYPPKKYLQEGGTISGGYLDERNHFDEYQFRFITPEALAPNVLYVWPTNDPQPCLTPNTTIQGSDGVPFVHIGVYDSERNGCT